MPVVNFHLVEGSYSPEQAERLLRAAGALYAEVLAAPVERIRAFISRHRPEEFLVANDLASNNGLHAPFFDFIVLEGRTLEQRQRLLAGFTALLVEILGVKAELIRGTCRRVHPEDWSIGGQVASVLRADEIRARAEAAAAAERPPQ